MTYRTLITALPCHSLDDFPTHHTADDAEGLLAAWCVPWHPALIAAAGRAPVWRYLHAWDEGFRESLIVVPEVARSVLTEDWQSRSVAQQTRMIVGRSDFQGMTDEALQSVPAELLSQLNPALIPDFHALAYWYLQVQLLTRKMRYSSRLDESRFQEHLLQAAIAATAGDDQRARDHLQSCFGVLAEERDHYYPVEAFVLDLMLVAPSTCGQTLTNELAVEGARNVLISGETLRHLASVNPAALDRIRQGWADGDLALIGGDQHELPLPLLSCETLLAELRAGQQTIRELTGRLPVIYGRRRFGMSPFLPQVLKRLGYRGVFHATLDDGRFPESTQARTQWQGVDGTTIDTLCSIPLDASRPETFLKFAVRMGESMELDHVATVCLAHWPGASSPWLDALRRGTTYGLALGRFVTAEKFFEHTSYAGHTEQYGAERYRSPYLTQAIGGGQVDFLSRHADWWREQVQTQAQTNLAAWKDILTGRESDYKLSSMLREPAEKRDDGESQDAAELANRSWSEVVDDLSKSLGGASGGLHGTLLVNPWSAPCRVVCDVPNGVAANHPDGPILAITEETDPCRAVVDVPASGFTWLPDTNAAVKTMRSRFRRPQPIAQNGVLQNEFLEAHIDNGTGGLRALFDYQSRGNRLSQQLVFVPPVAHPKDRPELWYSRMRAESVVVTKSGMTVGQITAKGELVGANDQAVATFCQCVELWRGSRVLRMSITIQPRDLPGTTPWKSYYANRLAWANEANTLHRDLHGTRQPAGNRQFEAPSYVEIDGATQHTYLLTGGLAFQQRVGTRMLDTLLIVQGESRQEFELGIGVDLRQPLLDAYSAMVPLQPVRASMPRAATGWLFHVDARNVVATGWEPLPIVEGDANGSGFRVRLQEILGRAATVTLQAVRPIRAARRVDFLGQAEGACTIEGDGCRVQLAPHEWTTVEVRW